VRCAREDDLIREYKDRPGKVVAVGLNYRDHATEFNMPLPQEPILFIKPATAVIHDGDFIVYPKGATRVDYEAELGVVIGRDCRRVRAEDAMNFIEGFTCVNDVTERNMQGRDGQWTRAKSFDTFCPIGPVVTDEIDPGDVGVRCYLNGELKQKSRTGNLIFTVEKIIEFASGVMTLEKGDVIATGTPSGVGPMSPGDEAVVEIDGVGRLVNRVIAER